MMTIWWVLGLVVASSKKKTSTLKCTNDDYLALTPEDHFSPIRMFRCLVIVDNNMPKHCNGAFYDSLSKNCTACTFGTLKATYLSCFNNCGETFNSDECMECTSSYVAHWKEKCLGEEVWFTVDTCPLAQETRWDELFGIKITLEFCSAK